MADILEPTTATVSVMTYNLWNVMFHWKVRQLYIAKLIQKENPSIVVFQEVRQGHDNGKNQLNELQALLPNYPYSKYVIASKTTNNPGEVEGLAILSKYEIIASRSIELSILPTDPDRNSRAALLAMINVPVLGPTFVIAGHLSYDRNVQCRNIAEIIQFLHTSFKELLEWTPEQLKSYNTEVHKLPIILAGDWNAYSDWDYPVALFEGLLQDNPCLYHFQNSNYQDSLIFQFKDAWKMIHPLELGNSSYTFSNMPWPGKQSRPDRILYGSECLLPYNVRLLGSGKEYKQEYYYDILWDRRDDMYVALSKDNTLLKIIIAFSVATLAIFALPTPKIYLSVRLMKVVKVILWLILVLWLGTYCTSPLFNYIAEEFFPSDHDAVMAKFSILCHHHKPA